MGCSFIGTRKKYYEDDICIAQPHSIGMTSSCPLETTACTFLHRQHQFKVAKYLTFCSCTQWLASCFSFKSLIRLSMAVMRVSISAASFCALSHRSDRISDSWRTKAESRIDWHELIRSSVLLERWHSTVSAWEVRGVDKWILESQLKHFIGLWQSWVMNYKCSFVYTEYMMVLCLHLNFGSPPALFPA